MYTYINKYMSCIVIYIHSPISPHPTNLTAVKMPRTFRRVAFTCKYIYIYMHIYMYICININLCAFCVCISAFVDKDHLTASGYPA